MKKFLIFMGLFLIIPVFAQEKSRFEIQDNLFKASIFNNLTLSKKLTIQNGISIRKDFAYTTLDIPLLLKYDVTNKWSTSIGGQIRTVITPNFLESSFFDKPQNNIFIGTDYEFKNNTKGSFSIEVPLDLQFGLKF